MKQYTRCCRCGSQKPGVSLAMTRWECSHFYCRNCHRLPSRSEMLEEHVSNVELEGNNGKLKKKDEVDAMERH